MASPVTTKTALLQALLLQGQSYGVELIERVKQRTDGEIVLHQGTVYPALRELEDEGFVESYESEPLPERGGRPRRYYRLTALGAKEARKQQEVVLSLFDVKLAGAQ
jgi:PadR family transcriptional regulator, regulatory protein PadR